MHAITFSRSSVWTAILTLSLFTTPSTFVLAQSALYLVSFHSCTNFLFPRSFLSFGTNLLILSSLGLMLVLQLLTPRSSPRSRLLSWPSCTVTSTLPVKNYYRSESFNRSSSMPEVYPVSRLKPLTFVTILRGRELRPVQDLRIVE